MFLPDQTPTPIPAWGANLQPGDVVLFYFPCAEDNPTDEPKSRACLVLTVETRGNHRFVELAYGTSANTNANVGDEIQIYLPFEMKAAGVRKPTRFVCARRISVSLDHFGWDLNPKFPSPVIGHLPPRPLARMNTIKAKITTLRKNNIVADSQTPRNFVVEHRRPRRINRNPQELRP